MKKPKINFSKARIEKIRKEFNKSRHKFSRSKINEIRRNLYEIENEKYYDYDDAEYNGIKDVKDLFYLSIDEDYYKPIITNGAFNNNHIKYESKGNKDKILTVNEYLDIIRPYLSNIINDHKTQGEWKIHSGNTTTEHKTQGE